jgi:hypothetical protein
LPGLLGNAGGSGGLLGKNSILGKVLDTVGLGGILGGSSGGDGGGEKQTQERRELRRLRRREHARKVRRRVNNRWRQRMRKMQTRNRQRQTTILKRSRGLQGKDIVLTQFKRGKKKKKKGVRGKVLKVF